MNYQAETVSLRAALLAAQATVVPDESEGGAPVFSRDGVVVPHPAGNVRANFGPHGWCVSAEDAGGTELGVCCPQTTDQAVGAVAAFVSLLDFRAEY